MDGHVRRAVENFVANARYRFLANDGPRIKEVTRETPLMYYYFVQPASHIGSVDKEEMMMNKEGQFIMATNGWVMGDDPLRNFAEADSNIYLRRELVNWGDSVKLRYGKSPEDCPYLWNHMTKYTQTTARIFHGVRLDNCHSTPLHVAEYMMDVARQVRPDLYVIGELFTGSEHLDNMFINRLGINSLIREAMSAWDAHEEGRLVYRYGGSPVGAFIQPQVQPLNPAVAHAMFFDQTHDNKCPIEVRSVYDIFPTAALVSMAFCASGSNRGYDELVPHHIHVVSEKRVYSSWSDNESDEGHVTLTSGIIAGKKVLNKLHYRLGIEGFNQVFVDQVDSNIVSVTRHKPSTHESVVLVCHTSFQFPVNPRDTGHIRPLSLSGKVEEILLEGNLVSKGPDEYKRSRSFINGLPEHTLHIRENVAVDSSEMVNVSTNEDPNNSHVHLKHFPPGSVVALRVSLASPAKEAILEYRKCLKQFGFVVRTYSGRTLAENKSSDFRGIVSRLNLSDVNRALYRCDAEERDDGKGFGAYDVPGCGSMVFCGLQGVISLLSHIRPHNDLGHPLCNNLREGDWLPSYIAARLKIHPGTTELGNWFEHIFDNLKKIPRYLIPCYFDAAVTGAYMILRDQALSLMSDFVNDGSTFLHALAMGSVQFCGVVKSSVLPELSASLTNPPPGEVDEDANIKRNLTLAAGFPHFASGYMRCWGRDTFIALRGLLLLTGRFQEARALILGFAACLRHGLIPNLLGGGFGARFNCRDAIWWWLQCIQDYTKLAPEGISILKDNVKRLFPRDDFVPKSAEFQQAQSQLQSTEEELVEQPLQDVMQEALQKHASGVKFRERNAGIGIDCHMKDEGFNNEIGVRWDCGFVYGGNEFNCGTWMDKMGGSEKAGNKGKPATPRDGSAVELIGLCKSSLRWLVQMNKNGHYPYSGVDYVSDGTMVKVTFSEWSQLILDNFEKRFWISDTPDVEREEAPELINRRAIYKDVYKGSQFWADTQLRPNFCVTMAVDFSFLKAPELFTPEYAWKALTTAQEVLLGPLGMKTLDPKDWAYAGDYVNSDDSGDPKVANGFNYHQGPEWIWPVGYFLRAKLHIAKILESSQPGLLEETIMFVKTTLTRHYEEIMRSPWQSLPELTNSDGKFCYDSCPAQAWSVATILEVLYDLEQLEADPSP
ncbi:glycogen debranching enzyme-like isoform X2 [Liolophura sinensis]|uniref:glycogen debranching enzyme-like isoform X2 n=1 Tax=Liolophura sinensis TaxID=3198878 RepID=UPI00315831A5